MQMPRLLGSAVDSVIDSTTTTTTTTMTTTTINRREEDGRTRWEPNNIGMSLDELVPTSTVKYVKIYKIFLIFLAYIRIPVSFIKLLHLASYLKDTLILATGRYDFSRKGAGISAFKRAI